MEIKSGLLSPESVPSASLLFPLPQGLGASLNVLSEPSEMQVRLALALLLSVLLESRQRGWRQVWEQSMATPPPDLPTILRALTLMTWALPSWKMQSFGNGSSQQVGSVAFGSLLAWESCLGASASTFEAAAGQGWHWAEVRVARRWAWGLGWDKEELGWGRW